MKNQSTVVRKSERELVISRTINGPARIVFDAWTKPELFKRWWAPKSCGLSIISFEADIRTGGSYRLVFSHSGAELPAFHGKYLEVTPCSRIVWTNEEAADGPVTTVTFEEQGGKTLVVLTELYPTKEALEAAMGSGGCEGTMESFEQLEDFLVSEAA